MEKRRGKEGMVEKDKEEEKDERKEEEDRGKGR